jgi:uncharacterized protein (TIGR03067 family)
MKGIERMLNRVVLLTFLIVGSPVFGAEKDPELQRFQGHWQVAELVEDGKVIPKEAIKEWLPSGGRAEIIENAIIFKSPQDGKKHAKVFSVDPTEYPKGIEVSTPSRKDSWGIYRFDEGKLVICLTDPDETERPKEFSAKAGSKRMLMVLKRPSAQTPAAGQSAKPLPTPKPTAQAGKVLTDDDVSRMLIGCWRLSDSAGSLFVTLHANGAFNTVREYQELRLFHKSFVQTPISSGTWSVKSGTLIAHVTTTVQLERLNQVLSFTVRSISDRDMIFVDQLGRVGSAVKVR